MAIDYSFPSWLIQRHSPWEALVSGVQAGAQIAANRQRGRALAAQIDHQQFQETVLRQKADADAQDLKTLQAWWPSFANAEGESLKTLQVPPLKNAQMWNRISMEVQRKKEQAAVSEFANVISTLNLADPADQAIAWGKVKGLPTQTMDMLGRRIDHAVTAEQRKLEAENLANYRNRMATVAEEKLLDTDESFTPQVLDVDGERVIQLSPKHYQYLGKTVPEEKLPATVRASIYKSKIDTAQKMLLDLDKSDPAYATWTAKLQEAEKNRDAMLAGGRPASAPTAQSKPAPAIGTVEQGYRFKGGDPSKQENWEKVQ